MLFFMRTDTERSGFDSALPNTGIAGVPQVNAPAPGGYTASVLSLIRSGWLTLLAFGFLWSILINQLRGEWELNPQYSYGWVVPFLCFGLLVRRWHSTPDSTFERSAEKLEPSLL